MTYTKQEIRESVKHILTVHSGMYPKKTLESFMASKKWQVRYAKKQIIHFKKEIRDARRDMLQNSKEAKAYEEVLKKKYQSPQKEVQE